MDKSIRNTDQYLIPLKKTETATGIYDLYPSLKLGSGKISTGISSFAEQIAGHQTLVIDGYIGVFFNRIRQLLHYELEKRNKKVHWIDIDFALKSEDDISDMIEPFLGGDDPIFSQGKIERNQAG